MTVSSFVPASPKRRPHQAWSSPTPPRRSPSLGEVIAVGPGRRSEDTGELIPMDVKTGDTVVYSKYGGTEIHPSTGRTS